MKDNIRDALLLRLVEIQGLVFGLPVCTKCKVPEGAPAPAPSWMSRHMGVCERCGNLVKFVEYDTNTGEPIE